MDNGFQFFDIILFAMIAVFLILRLRSVLGRRDGKDGGLPDIFDRLMNPDKTPGANGKAANGNADDNVIQLGDANDAAEPPLGYTDPEPQTPLAAGVAAIGAADRDFDIGESPVGWKNPCTVGATNRLF